MVGGSGWGGGQEVGGCGIEWSPTHTINVWGEKGGGGVVSPRHIDISHLHRSDMYIYIYCSMYMLQCTYYIIHCYIFMKDRGVRDLDELSCHTF